MDWQKSGGRAEVEGGLGEGKESTSNAIHPMTHHNKYTTVTTRGADLTTVFDYSVAMVIAAHCLLHAQRHPVF